MRRWFGGGGRLRVVEWFALSIGLLLVIATAGVAAGLAALSNLGDNRAVVVDKLDPALLSSLRLANAMLNQETSVRGYALGKEESFLEPYRRGVTEEQAALEDLDGQVNGLGPELRRDLAAAQAAAEAWRQRFAAPLVRDVGRGRPVDQTAGRALFNEVRSKLATLDDALQTQRDAARGQLRSSATRVTVIFLVFGSLLILTVLIAAAVLREVVVAPLGRLAERVRAVARGDFAQRVEADGGAREVVALGEDVEAMRRRIVTELDALGEARDELERSNAELEQFAYVASHDLQEPLRKVASFTQMLARRYEGQLDEKADQYIGFAVDGAKRMQDLINDLLAFSRVGRFTEEPTEVDTRVLVERAEAALGARLEDAGGAIVVDGELPVVLGEATLLGLVFQNLLGNALKFRSEEPPVVRVRADRDGDFWEFTVADNGIGIEPEYADRIFVIFQRLHPRTSYEGTGIGLAMCRKVVEYHGGRIWLDTSAHEGSIFHFTLPVMAPAVPGDDALTPETHPEEASAQ